MEKETTCQEQRTCCCSCDDATPTSKNVRQKKLPSFITGEIKTPVGNIPVIMSAWSWQDRLGHVLTRTSNSFRMKYAVKPGLYAIGSPDKTSPVLVSANYKLSFDILRKSLGTISAWVLVLDTRGINVWCAAGKGTFGTDELVARIKSVNLSGIVTHKRIVVPQLGAPGIASGEIQKETGFRVCFGPVRASDIPVFINADYVATRKMRMVTFSVKDRLTLVPMEINLAFKKVFWLLVFFAAVSAIQPLGFNIKYALTSGLPLFISAIGALLAGSILVQVLLPYVPFRSYAIKGWIIGILVQVGLILGGGVFVGINILLLVASCIFFPLLSSYIALQFTGSATYTSMAGVKKELKYALPVYISGSAVSFILFGIQVFMLWRAK